MSIRRAFTAVAMEDSEKARQFDSLHQDCGAKFGKNNAGAKELAGQYTKGERGVLANEPIRAFSLRAIPTPFQRVAPVCLVSSISFFLFQESELWRLSLWC